MPQAGACYVLSIFLTTTLFMGGNAMITTDKPPPTFTFIVIFPTSRLYAHASSPTMRSIRLKVLRIFTLVSRSVALICFLKTSE